MEKKKKQKKAVKGLQKSSELISLENVILREYDGYKPMNGPQNAICDSYS